MSLARSRTLVTPAAMFSGPSTSPTCTCMSQSPGRRVFPAASKTSAPAGTATDPSGPTAEIRSPETTTVVPGRQTAAAESKTFALRNTSGRPGLRDAAFTSAAARTDSAASWAFKRSGTVPSHPSRTTVNQSDAAAKKPPSASSQTKVGVKSRPEIA